MFLLLAGTILLGLLAYYIWWANDRRSYWDRKNIPNIPSKLFFGHVWTTSNPKTAWTTKLPIYTKKFGKFWGYQDGVKNILVTADLKTAKEVLITRFDEFQQRKAFPVIQPSGDDPRAHLAQAWGARWKRMRSLVSPQFSNNNLKRVFPPLADSAKHLLLHMEKKNGEDIDIHKYYQEYTMDCIARIAMGQKESTQWAGNYIELLRAVFARDPRDPFFAVAAAMPWFNNIIRKMFFTFSLFTNIAPLKLILKMHSLVSERKKERAEEAKDPSKVTKDHIDFIDLFLDAEATVDLAAELHTDRKDANLKQMTEQEVAMNCFLFLAAGFDTTSNSLSYCSWYLAKNPEVQRNLQDEIEQICGTEDISYDSLNELKYLDMVVKEALRLHPLGASVVCRRAGHDLEVAGIKIEEGDEVQIDADSIQMDPEIWGSDAAEFRPERWEELSSEQKDAFLTFGAGPRQCVGMRLAYMEEKLALANVLREFTIVESTNTEKVLDLNGFLTISPVSVTVKVEKRPN